MNKITVRELRAEFPKAMKWINSGESVQITKRGTVVAELSPPKQRQDAPTALPDFTARLEQRDKGKCIMPQTWADAIAEDRK